MNTTCSLLQKVEGLRGCGAEALTIEEVKVGSILPNVLHSRHSGSAYEWVSANSRKLEIRLHGRRRREMPHSGQLPSDLRGRVRAKPRSEGPERVPKFRSQS